MPIAVDEIPETGQHVELVAGPHVRAEIARMAGLRDVPRLEANFDLMRQDEGDVRVIGRVSATVGQNCVVTLEPLANEIEEEVDLLFTPRSAAPEPKEEGEGERHRADVKWDDPEPLIGGVMDLGALATEFLLLGVDPYPRKPGAVFERPRDVSADARPFAALAGWTKSRNDH
ncbi:MAG: YceD family protein [Xanthobacteraceae bacterium]